MKNAQDQIAAMLAAGQTRPFEVQRLNLYTQWEVEHAEVSPTGATLVTTVGGKQEHTAGEGVGPIHAFDVAFKKAVDAFFPQVERIILYAYEIKAELTGSDEIKAEGTGADAVVRCTIEFHSGKRRCISVVEHPNQDLAAFWAVLDGYTYFIMKEANK